MDMSDRARIFVKEVRKSKIEKVLKSGAVRWVRLFDASKLE